MSSNWKLGLGFSLITASLWGVLPFALHALLQELDSATITWFRFAAAAVLAWIWYGRKSKAAIKRLCAKPQRIFTIGAVAGLLINYVLFLHSMNFITPPAAELIIQLSPLMLLLGSLVWFNESFSARQWTGVLIFSIGLLLFFHHRFSELSNLPDGFLYGVMLVVASGITWTIYGLCQKKLIQKESSNDLLLLIYACGALAYLPFSSPAPILSFNASSWAILAFAALNTLVAYGSFGKAMTYWEASRVSAVITIAPLITLLFGAVMHYWQPGSVSVEPMDALSWFGGILVVVGSGMAALSNSDSMKAQ